MTTRSFSLIAALVLLAGHALNSAEPPASDWEWNLPKGFPAPYVPPDNPMTMAKVTLGRYLFYDTRLSVNGKQSCASCHKQELAFTDGRAVGLGATGESHTRGAMSLVNVAWAGTLTWNNPQMKRLEDQALVPMFGEHPVELGLREGDRFLPAIRADHTYQGLFKSAFPSDADSFTIPNVTKAIASFERSIVSARSPYDRYHYDGDDGAVSAAAKRGEVLYFSQHISCFRCHGGFAFTDSTVTARAPEREVEFHNTGVSAGEGTFKAPTLRNIAVTGPYMHDGSIPTLESILDHYASGGRFHDTPGKDPLIGGFKLSPQERSDMVEFLMTLTDEPLLHDPRFASPW